jgi:hypothetical protein
LVLSIGKYKKTSGVGRLKDASASEGHTAGIFKGRRCPDYFLSMSVLFKKASVSPISHTRRHTLVAFQMDGRAFASGRSVTRSSVRLRAFRPAMTIGSKQP